MINRSENPVAWALLLQGLDEAHEHLGALVKDLLESPDYSEEEFRVDLGHVFAHLNRAWNSRNISTELTDEQWEQYRNYPEDLEPLA